VRITGITTDELNGTYVLATVTLERPTAFDALLAFVDADRDVVSEASLFPEGTSQEDYLREQQQVFQESRELAAAAAAEAVGMKVRAKGSGARVVGTLEGAPAAKVLRAGDVIVRVDDRRIRFKEDVVAAIQARPAGSRLRVTFERSGLEHTATIRSTRLAGRGVVIGAQLETRDFEVMLPFEIEFAQSDIGGPSAGLAYALAIADMLDSGDFARGRTIAATGTIDVGGAVGAVGGIEQKAAGVEAAGADLFLVPEGEEAAVHRDGLAVRAVATLRDALRTLRVMA
jgi:Lon-like protease